MTQNRIMYVCTSCAENNPENCGHFDPNDLRMISNNTWLCEDCFSDSNSSVLWSDLPSPPTVDDMKKDYEEARASHLSHVLDLDRAMNGDGAAKAPLLIDIKDQLLEHIHRKPFGWAWRQKGRTDWDAWQVIKIKPHWLDSEQFEIKALYE